MSFRVAFAALLLLCLAPAAQACSDTTPCAVEGGEYLVRAPKGWDGQRPLPAVVFLHGYAASAEGIMQDEALGRLMSEAGVLLVAPQGLAPPDGGERGWSLPVFSGRERDDVAFLGRVVDDVGRRYPLDRARLLGAGFSLGGSMLWYVACRAPGTFAAYAPVAGAFWVPEPGTCAGAVSLRHVHGTADTTVPMTGRTIHTRTGPITQGDVLKSAAVLRATDGCRQDPTATAALF
ncbi:PHB depolymerase family esterase, partial [Nostoc sp. NIES-2111]